MTMASSSAADSLIHVAFNSKATHFVAVTSSGVRVFSCSPFKHVFSKDFPSPDGSGSAREVISADVVLSGQLVAVVFRESLVGAGAALDHADGSSSSGQGYKIRYWSELHQHMMRDDDMNPSCGGGGAVRAVRHVGTHVLVAGEDKAALHEMSRRGVKRTMEVDTGPNPLGVCALAQPHGGGREAVVLACPRPAKGEVQVRRGSAGGVDMPAHSSSIVCVALSHDGKLLATAGTKGTVIRIFTTNDGKRVQEDASAAIVAAAGDMLDEKSSTCVVVTRTAAAESPSSKTMSAEKSIKGTIVRIFHAACGTLLRELRRGADRADIYSMAFSPDSKCLAVSSDKGTIHVFSVNADVSTSVSKDSHDLHAGHEANANQDVKQGSYWSFLSGFVPGYFKQDYSLAKFRLPEDKKYLVAFSHEPNIILIIGVDGSFYRCEFDPMNGGDMKQLEYKNFMDIQ